ncbi:MFS transporter [Micromonospora sp. MS34]|uniref:MFS transporter n=1 Tax=Micromonospora sp. MS34 TaxID=3385971 RepID=UPI0039A0C553
MGAATRHRPPVATPGQTTRRSLGFFGAAVSLVAVFAASGTPIPLYERYREADGLTTADLSLAAVAYFGAVMVTLLVLGRLSDHLGRRVISVAAVAVAAAGCLALLDVHAVGTLAAGRVLQGIACGLASTALASYAVDTAPERPRWLGAATTAGAPLVGLTIGALGSGALVQYGPTPRQLVYLLTVALLVVCAVLILLSPETVTRSGGVINSLRPRVAVPAEIRPLLPAAAAVFVATWALGGFYQAFSPAVASDDLGTTNTLITAAVFASFMAPNAVGGPLTGRMPPVAAQRAGIAVFALAVVGIVLSLRAGAVVPVILAGLVAGAAQGAAFTGSMRAMLARISAGQRAGLLATVYLISYGGAAIPSLIAGRLSAHSDLIHIAAGYAALAVVAALLTTVALARRQLGTSQ